MNIYQVTIMEFLPLKIELLYYSQQPRYGNNLRIQQQMNGQRRYDISTYMHLYTAKYLSAERKKEIPPLVTT